LGVTAGTLWLVAAVFTLASFAFDPIAAEVETVFFSDHFAGFITFAARAYRFLNHGAD